MKLRGLEMPLRYVGAALVVVGVAIVLYLGAAANVYLIAAIVKGLSLI